MKSRERLCLEKMMQMLTENKRIQLDPDFGRPYTLSIIDLDEDEETPTTGSHTHSSYYIDDAEDIKKEKHMKGLVESFINHILGDKGGLSFA